MSPPEPDRIVRWEWHGSVPLLVLLAVTGILLPAAVVYFMTNLLRIETRMRDSEQLSEFLAARKP